MQSEVSLDVSHLGGLPLEWILVRWLAAGVEELEIPDNRVAEDLKVDFGAILT